MTGTLETTTASIKESIKAILAKLKAEPELYTRLPETADLVDDVGLDSLEMLHFMLEIEASLSVQIDFDKLEFSTVRSLHALATFLETMPPRTSGVG